MPARLTTYNEAVRRVIGEGVKVGAPVPAFIRSGLPADPREVKAYFAALDAFIGYATKLKEWPAVEEAVDLKIEEQGKFIRDYWDKNVTVRHRPGRGGVEELNAERGLISLPMVEAEARTGITQQQVSRWRKYLADAGKYRAQQLLAAYRKAGLEPAENFRALGTSDNEWFTPAEYIEAARSVMGDIDLDPATHPIAQATVQATQFFTAEDDGRKQEWHGRVWLNPPYAAPLIGQFVDKLVGEVSVGRVEQAILLTHNYTDAAWFHQAEAAADLLCFTRGRIKFVDSDGDECAPTQGQAFFYYGPNIDAFAKVFRQFGFVR